MPSRSSWLGSATRDEESRQLKVTQHAALRPYRELELICTLDFLAVDDESFLELFLEGIEFVNNGSSLTPSTGLFRLADSDEPLLVSAGCRYPGRRPDVPTGEVSHQLGSSLSQSIPL